MNKNIGALFVTVAIGLSLAANGEDAAGKERNLVRNPAFEELDTSGMAVGWARYNNMGQKATNDCYLAIDTETFKCLPLEGGGNAAKIVKNGGINTMLAQFGIAVEGGASYTLSMEHKESPGYSANIYVCVRQYDVGMKDITGESYYFATDTTPDVEWKTFSKRLSVLPNAAFLDLHISPNGQGVCWVKNVKLIKNKLN